MKSTPKWFLIPPAIAAMLILGSVSMQNAPPKASAATNAPAADVPPRPVVPATPETRTARPDPVLPKTPELWQMASALAGVLLLGWFGVAALRRLRHGPRAGASTSLLTLRQTLRLSGKQAIHAIEFDDRIVLVGEHERGLAVLDRGRLPERAADEAEIAARGIPALDVLAEEEGAVPKDLVIPRPAQPAQPRRLPVPPASPAAAPQKRAAVGLADFRNLLQKVARP